MTETRTHTRDIKLPLSSGSLFPVKDASNRNFPSSFLPFSSLLPYCIMLASRENSSRDREQMTETTALSRANGISVLLNSR